MKFTPRFFTGFGVALLIHFVVLLIIYLFFEKGGSFGFFLESSWDLKTLVGYLTIGSIPNVALFSYMIGKPETDFAQGVLTEVIIVLVFEILLKFVI